jgi:lipoyl(octanoyl) transferase
MKANVEVKNLGLIRYSDALGIQEKLFHAYVDAKKSGSQSPAPEIDGCFFLCEHKHVITLGKSGALGNLLLSNEQLKQKGVEFYQSSRGGDITYHGPGQIVGYPVLDLDRFGLKVKDYVHALEEVIIRVLADYDIISGRINSMTGVWLDTDKPHLSRKICAMGVKVSRWVSMHGFAFNVQTDLSYFDTIVPCGIQGKAVTSLSKELGYAVSLEEVQQKIIQHFAAVFNANMTNP